MITEGCLVRHYQGRRGRRAPPIIDIAQDHQIHLLARDLYDLAWTASRPFDEALVRRLVVLKVWTDVNDDGLGVRRFEPGQILRERAADDFRPEAVGYLTAMIDIPGWIEGVRRRFAFLRDLDEDERRWSLCSRSDEWEVRQAIAALRRLEP